MTSTQLFFAPAVLPILPAIHSLLVLVLLAGSGLLAGLWALRHPRAWLALLKFLWSQKWSLLSAAAVLGIAVILFSRLDDGGGGGGGASDEPPVLTDGHWPARGNLARTGTTADASAPADGTIQWVGGLGHTFYASCAVVGERVYGVGFTGDRSRLFCWDASDGRQLWTRAIPGMRATFSSPVIDGGQLIVGEGLHHTPSASLFVIDIRPGGEGQVLGRFTTASHIEGTPVVAGRSVYFNAGDDGVYALELPEPGARPVARESDQRPLKLRWHVQAAQIPDAETALCHHAGTVYIGSGAEGQALVALDAQTGREIGRLGFPDPVHGLPAVHNGRMYLGMGTADYVSFASSRGRVSCVDLESFRVLWSLPLEGTVLGAAACDEAGIVFGCTDGRVYAVDHDGNLQATWNSRAPILASVALTADAVLAVNQAGVLHALRRSDLEPLWQTRLPGTGDYFSAPVVGEGRVFIGTPGGMICLGPAQGDRGGLDRSQSLPDRGSILWRYRVNGRITSPPAVSDSTILLSAHTDDGPLLIGLRRVPDGPPLPGWTRKIEAPLTHSILTLDEIAIVSTPTQVQALDAPTGTPLWTAAASQSAPRLDRGRIWIDSGAGSAGWIALSFADGQRHEPSSAEPPPAPSTGDLVWEVDGSVLRLQRGSEAASQVWCDLSAVGDVLSEPVVAGATVYVIVSGDELVALGRAEVP